MYGHDFFLKTHPVGRQYPSRIRHVRVALRHGQGVVPGEVLHELRRHPRLQHLGDARVLERVEVVAVRHGQALPHPLPYGEQVLRGVGPASRLEVRGEDVCAGGQSPSLQLPEIPHHVVAERDGPLPVVLRHLRRDAQQAALEVNVARPQHEHLLGADQVPEAQAYHGHISGHPSLVEIIENAPAVLSGNGGPVFGLPPFPLEARERVVRSVAVADERQEHAFQVLEHAVEGVGAAPVPTVLVEDARGVGAGETPAEPVGDAGLFAPLGEERQLGAVAAHGILAEALLLLPYIFGGRLHDGDVSPGAGILAGERVPAVAQLAVHLRAEQGGVS